MGKICKVCEEELPFESFHVRRASTDGYDYRCKDCRQKQIHNTVGLNEAADRVSKPARKILERLGYDTDGDVHEQFMERWGELIYSSIERNKFREIEDEDTHP